MSRKWGLGVAAVLIAVIVVIVLQSRPSQAPEQQNIPQVPQSAAREPDSVTKAGLPKSDSVTDSAVAQSTAGTAPVDPEFQKWIAEEAKSLNYHNVDGAKKEAQIREVVAKITPAQAQQLLHTARNSSAPAGEKILATYLMVEGGLNTRKELLDFVNDEVAPGGEPHSEDEVKGVREKSLRIMAIDGLFSQAQKDPGARAALAREIETIQDPYIKGYAERKLEELERSQQ
jgi:hypothetical protein